MNVLAHAGLAIVLVLAAWFGAHAGMTDVDPELSYASAMELSEHARTGMDTATDLADHESHRHCPVGYCTTACVSAVAEQSEHVPAKLISVAPIMLTPDPATASVFPELPPPQLS